MWAMDLTKDRAGAQSEGAIGNAKPAASCRSGAWRLRGDRKEGASMMAGNVFRGACLLILTASFGLAGEAPAPEAPGFRGGVGLLVATGLGSMFTDLNGHPGFGLTIQGYLPLGSRFQLRPAFEWTGYRVNQYNLASRILAELLGVEYWETRVVFRTYRLGLDGVIYFREQYRGPYLSGGVGVQLSRVYLEDVAWYGAEEEEVRTVDAGCTTTGLWLGGGAGYQWEVGTVELRLSRAPYSYTSQRPPDTEPNTLPFEGEQGWALHLILGVRF
jgi:hypothetical protein